MAGALIIGGSSLASGALGFFGSRSASRAQVQAEQQALAFQEQQAARLNPFINVGTGATYTLGQMYGIGQNGQPTNAGNDFSQFYNSPDYQFAQDQGNLALTRAENARGMNLSGGALRDIASFNQGLASQQFGNYFSRLMSLSQLGAQSASAGVGAGNAIAGTMGQIGQSQASGIIGGANAITGGTNSGITNSLLYNAINRSGYAAPSAASPTSTFMNSGIEMPTSL